MTQPTIAELFPPKTDQWNYEHFKDGSMKTFTIQAVVPKPGSEQPLEIVLGGTKLLYRPCASMARMLDHLWGDYSKWPGKRLTLFGDHAVKVKGVTVGGIRISHVSDLGARQKEVTLRGGRGKTSIYVVKALDATADPRIDAIRSALKDLWPGDENAAMRQKIYTDNGVTNPGKYDWLEASIESLEKYIETEKEGRQ
jgi:hypothetical protein